MSKINRSYINNQAVQVLNKIEYDQDSNPIGMIEDPYNTLSANFGTDRLPRRGGCYKFYTSSTARVETPVFNQYANLNLVNLSISFWIKPNAEYTNTYIIDNVDTYGDQGIIIRYSTPTIISAEIFVPSLGKYSISTTITSAVYQFITVTWDHILKIFKIYRNGVLIQSDNLPDGTVTVIKNSNFFIGQLRDNPNNIIYSCNSNILDIRFYDVELSLTHILDIYNRRNILIAPIANYKCSENSGSICYDSSGNGNHGTIVNAITTTPEINPNSIHQYQDVYSWENEVGYTGLITPKYYTNTNALGINYNDVIVRMKLGNVVVDNVSGYMRILHFDDNNDLSTTVSIVYPNLGSKKLAIWINNTTLLGTTLNEYDDFLILFSKTLLKLKIYNYSTGLEETLNLPVNTNLYLHRLTLGLRYQGNYGVPLNGNILIAGFKSSMLSLEEEFLLLKDLPYSKDQFDIYFNSEKLIPRNESLQLPPFKDVLGNNLQYIGKVPGRAKFVESNCFQQQTSATYMTGDVLTTDTITAFGSSLIPTCTVNGRLDFPVIGGKYYGISIYRSGELHAYLPLCESIITP